ncbi:tRNA (adenosine(37)-N6)-threonylcarbamoyltransferase complex ATPase subunit type 1 TsaE [Psychrosphaera saromensis]|jgi:tRNA threonylcarbamoyladenosine biosynthesis protein TsaE|uniref:tRNA threonylcarbamoyladenosine biosynthesis protein TsaE n=1 Tax=Psychrosphaera saromensis TaxID=716813 RepID=A0A2S7UUX2_9GAMM|nr:tRNA (adenosine(37)-N6)-threonylcarbamoyltransferase complex ATPase subunit type 1 TsaE [Psychrosphaera saromensis]PQJ53081.1 tRNA (adenosine(37)-N6)-threonylcarbamoyltransferase complex ATPase subunit type 1 TsaE [Psychrosphaera saromensis]GHB68232.1 tRNA (adenosine(37)-N6)-threonylcarbamoyltransferase complex ATPase subunit type 1 TsaE [Psychrosphaera saromensis]GLQ15167.1 tRNA (adenosine(37)-N6)-threonylcarbamoyltransferase complex ATPase subunit type 1 TsaE [Psychrosphaera saromensis]
MNQLSVELKDESATVLMGNKLSQAVKTGAIIYLHGDLGAGKTTFTRGVIQGLGHKGNVKSPTYTLVEPYELNSVNAYHFDLYRLGDPEELEFMGIRDYFELNSLCLIEWPERGAGILPEADLDITLEYVDAGRVINLVANNPKGLSILALLEQQI